MNTHTAQIGTQICFDLIDRAGNRERLTYDIVPDSQADSDSGFLSASAPIAQAVLGETAGSLIPYFTAELQAIHLLEINPSTRQPNKANAQQKAAQHQETLHQLQYRDALLFAASANTKWGSYDPDGLNYDHWTPSTPPPEE